MNDLFRIFPFPFCHVLTSFNPYRAFGDSHKAWVDFRGADQPTKSFGEEPIFLILSFPDIMEKYM